MPEHRVSPGPSVRHRDGVYNTLVTPDCAPCIRDKPSVGLALAERQHLVDGEYQFCDRSRDKSAPTISICLIKSRLEASSADRSRNITAISRLRAGTVTARGFSVLWPRSDMVAYSGIVSVPYIWLVLHNWRGDVETTE